MAIINANYDLPFGQTSNPYVIADDEAYRNWLKTHGGLNAGTFTASDGVINNNQTNGTDTVGTDATGVTDTTDATGDDKPITGDTNTDTVTSTTPAAGETATSGTEEDSYAELLKQLEEMTKSGSVTEQYKAAIMAAVKAQQLTTQQAIDKINYQKEEADKARVKSNRESDLTFSRAINPTGKINQNIRSAGLAGSGWQETSQVGLTNAYQNA